MSRQLSSRLRFRVVILVLMVLVFMAGGCSSSRGVPKRSGVDENSTRLNRSARIAYDNGQLEQSANLYRQALNRAYLRDDRKAVVDAQYNLAVCMLGLRTEPWYGCSGPKTSCCVADRMSPPISSFWKLLPSFVPANWMMPGGFRIRF